MAPVWCNGGRTKRQNNAHSIKCPSLLNSTWHVDHFMAQDDQNSQIEKMAQEAIEEARMVLPGIQALFGFQLIAVFNEGFKQLTEFHKLMHYGATILIALAIALMMKPAAYHRQVESGSVSPFFVKLASGFVTALFPLMFGVCIEVYLLGRLVVQNEVYSVVIAALLMAVFASLWFLFPYVMRQRRHGGRDGRT